MGSDRAKFEDDFSFVRDHLSDFFDRGSIRHSLDLIYDVGITGWENGGRLNLLRGLQNTMESGIGLWRKFSSRI